jgi:hypothetical protein
MEVEGKLGESTRIFNAKFLFLGFTFSTFFLLEFRLFLLLGWVDGWG